MAGISMNKLVELCQDVIYSVNEMWKKRIAGVLVDAFFNMIGTIVVVLLLVGVVLGFIMSCVGIGHLVQYHGKWWGLITIPFIYFIFVLAKMFE